MAEALAPLKVRMASLTGRQVQTIERAVGVPMSRWEERASDVELAAAIRSAVEGRPVEEYLDYSAVDLVQSIEVDDQDDDPGNDSGEQCRSIALTIMGFASHGISYTPDQVRDMTVDEVAILTELLNERAREQANENAMAEARALRDKRG